MMVHPFATDPSSSEIPGASKGHSYLELTRYRTCLFKRERGIRGYNIWERRTVLLNDK